MDQAKGILAFIQSKHPDKGYDVEGVMSVLVNCDRSPDYVLPEVSCTVQEISTISAKSYFMLFRTISLLKLSPEVKAAIQQGTSPFPRDISSLPTSIAQTLETVLSFEFLVLC